MYYLVKCPTLHRLQILIHWFERFIVKHRKSSLARFHGAEVGLGDRFPNSGSFEVMQTTRISSYPPRYEIIHGN
jgi:hypothetical protein